MIRWDAAGDHIIVEKPEQLALHVLPSIYRQSRFASFSRQLNVRPPALSISEWVIDPIGLLFRSTVLCGRSTFATSTLPLTIQTQVHGVGPPNSLDPPSDVPAQLTPPSIATRPQRSSPTSNDESHQDCQSLESDQTTCLTLLPPAVLLV